MYRKLGFRFVFRIKGTRLKESARYSVTSYVSTLLNLLPLLALPTIVLRTLGSEQSAYYFMAFQIATLLSAASYAISQSLFSEGAHDPGNVSALLRRSARIMALIVVPGAVALAALGRPVLSIFGAGYAQHAQGLLVVLSLGSVAVAFNSWTASALRIVNRMRSLVVSDVVLTVTVLGLAGTLGSRGLLWMGYAWVAGNLLSGLVAAVRIPRHPDAVAAEAAANGDAQPTHALQPMARYNDLPTEPMFFPWNRPEAIRFGQRSRTTAEIPRITDADLRSSPLNLHLSGMQQRPYTRSAGSGWTTGSEVPARGLHAEPGGVPQQGRTRPATEPPGGVELGPTQNRALRTDESA
jgi:hypothetical protein